MCRLLPLYRTCSVFGPRSRRWRRSLEGPSSCCPHTHNAAHCLSSMNVLVLVPDLFKGNPHHSCGGLRGGRHIGSSRLWTGYRGHLTADRLGPGQMGGARLCWPGFDTQTVQELFTLLTNRTMSPSCLSGTSVPPGARPCWWFEGRYFPVCVLFSVNSASFRPQPEREGERHADSCV